MAINVEDLAEFGGNYQWPTEPEEAPVDAGYTRYVQDLEKQRDNFAKFGSYYERPSFLDNPFEKPTQKPATAKTVDYGWHWVGNDWQWMKEPPKPAGLLGQNPPGTADWKLANELGTPMPFGTAKTTAALSQAKQGPGYNKFVDVEGKLPLDIANSQFRSFEDLAQKVSNWGYSIVDVKSSPTGGGLDPNPYDTVTIGKQDPTTGQWGNFMSIGAQETPQGVNTWNLTNVTGENRLPGEQLRPGVASETIESNIQAQKAAQYNLVQKAWRDPAFKMGYTQWNSLNDAQKEQLIAYMDEQGVTEDKWLVYDYTFLDPEWQDRDFTMTLEEYKKLDGLTKNRIAQMLEVQGREIDDFVIQPAVAPKSTPRQPAPAPIQAGAIGGPKQAGAIGGPKAGLNWGTPRWQ